MKNLNLKFIVIAMTILMLSTAHAQTVQIILEENITPDITANVLVVADNSQKTQVKETFKQAVINAREMQRDLQADPLLKGYLADQIAKDMTRGGFENIFIDLGDVYTVKGKDFNGPWKIPVVDDTTATAHHAFVYRASNDVSAATVKGNSNDLKSVTVFTTDGAYKAQGLAYAGLAAGLSNAKKMLKASDSQRSVLIDNNGQFVQIPEGK